MSVASLAPLPHQGSTDPQDAVSALTAAAKSSFTLGMTLLARPRREAMHAVYAFCRVVDDIADGDPPADTLTRAEKRALLDDWRAEIERLYAGAPVSTIGRALAGPVERYRLPKQEFLLMIEGMEIDADGPVVAPTRAALHHYTRRVAGSVGQLSMLIFGAEPGPETERMALTLADAIQITNILRDVEEDASIGRVYLPREMLEDAGIPCEPEAVARHPALPTVCKRLGAEAAEDYARAATLIRRYSRLKAAPALAMMGVYRRYLELMAAQDFRRNPAPSLSSGQKLRAGLLTVVKGS